MVLQLSHLKCLYFSVCTLFMLQEVFVLPSVHVFLSIPVLFVLCHHSWNDYLVTVFVTERLNAHVCKKIKLDMCLCSPSDINYTWDCKP